MSEIKTVWEQGSMSTTVETHPPAELIEHIEKTFLGTPGGLQYHHTTGVDKLKNIPNCYFVLLRRHGNLLGSIGYVLRDVYSGDHVSKSWLVRYFSVKAPLRTEKKAKKEIKRRPVKDRAVSLLKDITHIFHDNPERLIDIDVDHIPKSTIFSLVEKDNERSRNFAEIGGYSKTGEIESFMFSRLRKRKIHGAEKLPHEERGAMKQKLRDFYKEHSFYFEDYLFLNNAYYVIRKEGEIVAGLQANEEMWEIKTIGNSFLDKVIRSLTRLPMIGKRFKYEEMRFLGIEGIFFAPGHEKDFYTLLEGVLALKNRYLALLIMDTRSPVYNMFKTNRKLGPVNSILGSFEADIYTKFFSFTDKEKELIAGKPAYISIFDNT